MMNTNSLQDLIFELKTAPSLENANLLLVADLIICYFNRPAHQITIQAIKSNKGYFMLYLSFLHLPFESIDHFVDLVGALVAKAEMTVRENGEATETNAAESTLKNCAEQALNAMPSQTTGHRPVLC
jgi:hypothetical protein